MRTFDAQGSDLRLRLSCGRTVTYAVLGDPTGDTVFYFHGFPSSRFEAALHASAARDRRVRLVALDRPGYGGSDPKRLTINEVANDVVEVADALESSHFGVLGVSGGGPYALACASLHPARVRGVALMAPLGPPEAPRYGMRPTQRSMLAIAGRSRVAFGAVQRALSYVVLRNPERVVRALSKTLPEREQRLVDDDSLRHAFAEVLRGAFQQKGAGPSGDGGRLARSWKLDLSRVRAPVQIWHGLVDDIVPPGMGGYMQAVLAGHVGLTLAPLDGHFSLVRNYIDEVLTWLTSRPTPRGLASRGENDSEFVFRDSEDSKAVT